MRHRQLRHAGGAAPTVPLLTTTATSRISQTDETTGYEPLGCARIENTYDAAVHHDGEIVYVAVTDGFVSVDISTPYEPTVLAERRGIYAESGKKWVSPATPAGRRPLTSRWPGDPKS